MHRGDVVVCVKKVAESFAVSRILRTFAAETVKSAQDTMDYQTFVKTLEGGTLSLPIDQDGRICYDIDKVYGGVRISCTLLDKDGDPFFASFDYVSIRYAFKVYQELQSIQYGRQDN